MKIIKRIHWDVVLLVVQIILENPEIKRTRLAQKCNRNYQQMTLYLEWMKLMKIIIFEKKDKKTFIRITDQGKEIFTQQKTNCRNKSLEK